MKYYLLIALNKETYKMEVLSPIYDEESMLGLYHAPVDGDIFDPKLMIDEYHKAYKSTHDQFKIMGSF